MKLIVSQLPSYSEDQIDPSGVTNPDHTKPVPNLKLALANTEHRTEEQKRKIEQPQSSGMYMRT